jgi:hypothetical protein
LRFTGGAGIAVTGAGVGTLTNVLITGDGSTGTSSQGRGLDMAGSVLSCNGVCLAGFGGSQLLMRSSVIALINNFYTFGGNSTGMNIQSDAAIDMGGLTVFSYGNAGAGVSVIGGRMTGALVSENIIAQGNAGNGCQVTAGGAVVLSSCLLNQNGANGCQVSTGGAFRTGGGFLQSNALWGVDVAQGFVTCIGSALGSNTSGRAQAFDGANVLLNGTSGTGTLSPAANTVGNRNAYIGVI